MNTIKSSLIFCLFLVLHSCTPDNVNLASLLDDTESQLGEGAIWDHDNGRLLWVDILSKTLYLYYPKDDSYQAHLLPGRIGTVVPIDKRYVALAIEDGIYRLDLETERLDTIALIEPGLDINRFNDGKCDPSGRLWAGTMNLAEDTASGSLYCILPDGTFERKLDQITISNGIVWSSDKRKMYYIDTPTGNIDVFDYDDESGKIANRRLLRHVEKSLGFPDGMAIDSEDNLWVGLWNGNAVAKFDGKTGELLDKIAVPAHNVTSCAFGGDQLKTLYITTARVDMSDDELKQYPLAGGLFTYKVDVSGAKSPNFR